MGNALEGYGSIVRSASLVTPNDAKAAIFRTVMASLCSVPLDRFRMRVVLF